MELFRVSLAGGGRRGAWWEELRCTFASSTGDGHHAARRSQACDDAKSSRRARVIAWSARTNSNLHAWFSTFLFGEVSESLRPWTVGHKSAEGFGLGFGLRLRRGDHQDDCARGDCGVTVREAQQRAWAARGGDSTRGAQSTRACAPGVWLDFGSPSLSIISVTFDEIGMHKITTIPLCLVDWYPCGCIVQVPVTFVFFSNSRNLERSRFC